MATAKETVRNLLSLADIQINGKRPFDIQVHDDRLYGRVLGNRELGLGESYMDGWWDVAQLDEFIARLLSANLQEKLRVNAALVQTIAKSTLLNLQTPSRAKANAASHYD